MATEIGKYLKKLKANKAQISRQTGISTSRINAITNSENAKPYADEIYKIVFFAQKNAGLTEEYFNKAIREIYSGLKTIDLLEEFQDLSPEAKFFKKYTLQQKDIEAKLNIAPGKISKYFNDKSKRALASDIIAFAGGMKLDILEAFKELFGELD